MAVRLHVVRGEREQTLAIGPGRYLVGRAPDCDLRVADPHVSQYHAEITRHGHVLVIRDLGSRNGTYLNHQRIFGPWVITDGDRISLGSLVLEAVTVAAVTAKVRHPPVDSVRSALIRLAARDYAVDELQDWLRAPQGV